MDQFRRRNLHDIINPATEESIGQVAYGTADDVDLAVAAARTAFEEFSQWTVEQRLELLGKIEESYLARYNDMAEAITAEMGAPTTVSQKAQAATGVGHLRSTIAALQAMELEEKLGNSTILKEPIGVCGLITPWNWPINQIVCKVAPAIAAGCTVVLKPSEIAPVNATIFAEILEAAGVPAGVFNLVHGDGPGVGSAMSAHPGIDMMSFTGSTRAGILVAKSAADTVKRVAQELGGKSANIILEGAPLEKAIKNGVIGHVRQYRPVMQCTQPDAGARKHLRTSCRRRGSQWRNMSSPEIRRSPKPKWARWSAKAQYNKIQGLIEKGIEEGARLVLWRTRQAGRPGQRLLSSNPRSSPTSTTT